MSAVRVTARSQRRQKVGLQVSAREKAVVLRVAGLEFSLHPDRALRLANALVDHAEECLAREKAHAVSAQQKLEAQCENPASAAES